MLALMAIPSIETILRTTTKANEHGFGKKRKNRFRTNCERKRSLLLTTKPGRPSRDTPALSARAPLEAYDEIQNPTRWRNLWGGGIVGIIAAGMDSSARPIGNRARPKILAQ